MTDATSSPTCSQIALVAAKRDEIPIDLAEVPATPKGPRGRLAGAAREAWGTACALRAESIDQRGVDPVLLVCAVDCAVGRGLVERNLGPLVPACVCGPVVLTAEWPELVSALGGPAAKVLTDELAAMKVQAGEMVLLFAVNGRNLDLRVARAFPLPSEDASTAPAEPPPAAAPAAPAAPAAEPEPKPEPYVEPDPT